MAKYAYTAIDQQGKEQFGVLEAASEEAALKEVARRGLFVTEVREAWMADELRASLQEKYEHGKQRREQEEARHQQELRKRHPRQRLVVRYRNGRVAYGICFAMNTKAASFYLDVVDKYGQPTGEREQVNFSDLKAVFSVRSFDGKHGRSDAHPEFEPQGEELFVVFKDKEVIRGRSLAPHNPNEPRFYLVPKDSRSNNLNVLVERDFVDGVYTPEDYRQKREAERSARHKEAGTADISQEESMGDFYYDSRNYAAALSEYKKAAARFPESRRIRKKLVYAEFNNGVQYIKRREYREALTAMERVLELDPPNEHAKKKAHQLRKILEKGAPRPQKEFSGGQVQELD